MYRRSLLLHDLLFMKGYSKSYNRGFFITLMQHNNIYNAYFDLDFTIGKWY